MTGGTNRLTRQDCLALRSDLRNLGCGQADREAPEIGALRLYPVREHLHALDPNVVLVVGPRGSGKTALFNLLSSNDRELVNAVAARMPRVSASPLTSDAAEWVKAYPAATDFPDSQALSKCVRSDEDAKKLWHAMLVRRLADRIHGREREKLTSILAPMAVEVREILAAYDDPDTSATAALDRLERKLQQEDGWMFVGYDELDTLGDWSMMTRMVRGLVAFWSDYSRRWRRVRAKIFLRSDLFRRHAGMATADFAKLAANRAELPWSDAALLGMLVKRIANTSGDLEEYCRRSRIRFEQDGRLGLMPRIEEPADAFPLLRRLVGEYMGAGKKKGLVTNWLPAHLRDGNDAVSPRSLVRLIEQAAGKDAANKSLRPPRLIHPTALRQALDDVSGEHVGQGITSEWPWLEGVRRRLEPDRLVSWKWKRVVELLGAEWGGSWGPSGTAGRPPADQPAELLDYLIEIGVFRRRSDDRVDVTDLYLSGLRLRRKGGVKLGPMRHGARRNAAALGRRREE